MKNRKCIVKAKTAPARRTLDPLYQQQLTFREDYRQCILQVSFSLSISVKISFYLHLFRSSWWKSNLVNLPLPFQLKIIVWGDYGRMNHKALMGIVQIQLDDLNLSSIVIGWYKLFNPSSMTSLPSKSLRHSMLSSSTQSFTWLAHTNTHTFLGSIKNFQERFCPTVRHNSDHVKK